MPSKKILIHSLIFSPDGVSTAYLYNDIALAFKEAGYEVVVLTTTPHFNVVEKQIEAQPLRWGVWGVFKRSEFSGIPVYHVPQKKFKSTVLRLLGFVYWHVVSFFVGLCIRNIDVILSPSPPLTIGRLNQLLGWLKRCKVVYNVQEIYPDILHLREDSLVNKFLRRMEYRVYNGSDAVTTIDQVFYNTIEPRFVNSKKLHIIPNFVDTDLYCPDVPTEGLDKEMFPESDSLKILYAGNIGYAQDWDTLIMLADKTRNMNVDYFVIGEGVMKGQVEKTKEELRLDRLHILPYQSRELMPAILSYSDIQFIFMTPQMEGQGFPSKVYTIMACARPLFIGSGEDTPIVNFLKPLECAKIFHEHDVEVKTDRMAEWLSTVDRMTLKRMGKRGEYIIQNKYSKDIVTRQYVDLVESILK